MKSKFTLRQALKRINLQSDSQNHKRNSVHLLGTARRQWISPGNASSADRIKRQPRRASEEERFLRNASHPFGRIAQLRRVCWPSILEPLALWVFYQSYERKSQIRYHLNRCKGGERSSDGADAVNGHGPKRDKRDYSEQRFLDRNEVTKEAPLFVRLRPVDKQNSE